jgi:hypothetical protein
VRNLIYEQEVRITPPVPRGEIDASITEADGDPEALKRRVEEFRAELEHPIVLTLRVARHLDGLRRARAIRTAIELVRAEMGEGEISPEMTDRFIVLRNAADIVGALVAERCERFEVPADLTGWLEVPDYVMTPALTVAWELNPHWAEEYGSVKNG